MLEVNFNPFPGITTERLVLRQITTGDVNEILFLRSDAEVMKYINKPPAQSLDDAMKFVQMIEDAVNNNTGISWAITLKDDNTMIGNIALWRLIKEHYRAEIGYILHPQHWGNGIMNEALAAVVDYAFNTMKLHSIEADINPDNIASQLLLERNNFLREAYFKENFYYDGQFLDSAIYSLLAPKQ